MKSTLYRAITFVVFLVLCATAYGEPPSKIAVVDISKVLESFPEESRVFRTIERLRETYEERMAEYTQQLDDIELAIIDAKNDEDDLEVSKLEDKKKDVQDDRRTFHDIQTRRIQNAYKELSEGEGIVEEVFKAIEYIAINEGFSIVLESTDSRIWWFSKEIDITDLVIDRLRATTQ